MLSSSQLEALTYLERNRHRLEGTLRRRGIRPATAEDAVSNSIVTIADAFERHPDWPDQKFATRQSLLAYATTSSRYAAYRLIREAEPSAELPEVVDEGADPRSGNELGGVTTLVANLGTLDANILRARTRGLDLVTVAAHLQAADTWRSTIEVADRLLLLVAEFPGLAEELPEFTGPELQTVHDLVATQVTTLTSTEVESVVLRLARPPSTRRGPTDSAWSRLHRALPSADRAWVDDRTPRRLIRHRTASSVAV